MGMEGLGSACFHDGTFVLAADLETQISSPRKSTELYNSLLQLIEFASNMVNNAEAVKHNLFALD
jgi:hypothetical protein